jgi:hypothetical protein
MTYKLFFLFSFLLCFIIPGKVIGDVCNSGEYSINGGTCNKCPLGFYSFYNSTSCYAIATLASQFNLCVVGSGSGVDGGMQCLSTPNTATKFTYAVITGPSLWGQYIFNFNSSSGITYLTQLNSLTSTSCIIVPNDVTVNKPNSPPNNTPLSILDVEGTSLCEINTVPYKYKSNFYISFNYNSNIGYLGMPYNFYSSNALDRGDTIIITTGDDDSLLASTDYGIPFVYIQCGQGYGMNEFSINCKPCFPGTYSPRFSGQSECSPCPAGTYSNEVATVLCKPCPSGLYSSVGSSSCAANCPYGYSTSADGACIQTIVRNTTRPDVSNLFHVCTNNNNVESCLSNTKSVDTGNYNSLWNLYKYINYPKILWLQDQIYNPFMYYLSNPSQIVSVNSSDLLPDYCYNSSYSVIISQLGNQLVFSANISNKISYIESDDQKNISFLQCQPGYEALISSLSSYLFECQQCKPGNYSIAGQSFCQPCPTGSYSAINGATSCITCPYGTYSFNGSICVYCPPGTGAVEPNGCEIAPAGTFSIGRQLALILNADPTPQSCPSGSFSIDGSSICSTCPAGTQYANSSQPNTCILCTGGTYNPYPGSPYCLSCIAPNYFSTNGSTICTSNCSSPSNNSYTCGYFYNNIRYWCPNEGECNSSPSGPQPFEETQNGVITISVLTGLGGLSIPGGLITYTAYTFSTTSSSTFSESLASVLNGLTTQAEYAASTGGRLGGAVASDVPEGYAALQAAARKAAEKAAQAAAEKVAEEQAIQLAVKQAAEEAAVRAAEEIALQAAEQAALQLGAETFGEALGAAAPEIIIEILLF